MYKKTTGKYGTYQTYFYDTENNNWVWISGSTYYLSAIAGLPITVDGGANINVAGFIYNAKDYYTSGSLYYFYDSTNGYVATSYLGFGMTSDKAWWKCATLAGTYVKQGTASADKIVAMGAVAGRSSATLTGVYTPVTGGGMTGDKYVGVSTYDYGDNNFVESSTVYGGKSVFNDDSSNQRVLWWSTATSKWIISEAVGTKETLTGYWENTTLTGTFTRFFTGTGDAPLPVSYTLPAPTYSEGSNQTEIKLAQVGLWL